VGSSFYWCCLIFFFLVGAFRYCINTGRCDGGKKVSCCLLLCCVAFLGLLLLWSYYVYPSAGKERFLWPLRNPFDPDVEVTDPHVAYEEYHQFA